jgi:hypothetical protein
MLDHPTCHRDVVSFAEVPAVAAWQHHDLRTGFEVATFTVRDDHYVVHGATTAAEGSTVWAVEYYIVLDSDWITRRVRVNQWSAEGRRAVRLDREGTQWCVNMKRAPDLDDCLDVDLESSVLTNAFPVRRNDAVSETSWSAPAAYVRASDLKVSRLEQRYTHLASDERHQFAYEAPEFDFRCQLEYDAAGLILHYPGIAVRAR